MKEEKPSEVQIKTATLFFYQFYLTPSLITIPRSQIQLLSVGQRQDPRFYSFFFFLLLLRKKESFFTSWPCFLNREGERSMVNTVQQKKTFIWILFSFVKYHHTSRVSLTPQIPESKTQMELSFRVFTIPFGKFKIFSDPSLHFQMSLGGRFHSVAP